MKYAQDVRMRRLSKLRELQKNTAPSEVIEVFESILSILDMDTIRKNFDGVDVYIGDIAYKQYIIRSDGFYDFENVRVRFKEPTCPFDFIMDLRNFINCEEGFEADVRKYAPNAEVIHINIKQPR